MASALLGLNPGIRAGHALSRLAAAFSQICVAVLSGPSRLISSPRPIPLYVQLAATSWSSQKAEPKGRTHRKLRCTACGELYPREELRVERDEDGFAIGLLCPICY